MKTPLTAPNKDDIQKTPFQGKWKTENGAHLSGQSHPTIGERREAGRGEGGQKYTWAAHGTPKFDTIKLIMPSVGSVSNGMYKHRRGGDDLFDPRIGTTIYLYVQFPSQIRTEVCDPSPPRVPLDDYTPPTRCQAAGGGGRALRRLTRAIAGGHQDLPGARGDVHPGLLVVTTEPNGSILRAVPGNLATSLVLSSQIDAFEPSLGAGIKSTFEPQNLRPVLGMTPKQSRYSARLY